MESVVICHADFDVGSEYAKVCDAAPQAGAVVFFVGLVRDLYNADDPERRIEYLELEHYAGMTEQLCQEIIDDAKRRYSIDCARVLHRVGKIYAHEQIVMVSVASRHRDTAFKAAEFIMDYLKTRATFWKKEVGSKGAHWVGKNDKDVSAVKRWDVLQNEN